MAKQEKFGVLIEGKETVSIATKKASTGLGKLGVALSNVKVQLLAYSAAMWAIIRVMGSAITAYAQQEQAVARLTQALKNQNTFSKENFNTLTQQAKALQRLTVFGDEQIISAQAMLASFALTSKQIEEMTPRMLDLATMTAKTSGGMMDLEQSAKFVGMALGGQAGRLTQAGIRLNDYQKATFQAANETERFNMLIEIFDQNAAGLAESVGQTASASVTKLKNVVSDLNEKLGESLLSQKGFRGEVELLIKVMSKLAEEKEKNIKLSDKELTTTDKLLISLDKYTPFLGKLGVGISVVNSFRREGTEIIERETDVINENTNAVIGATNASESFLIKTKLKLDLLKAETDEQRKAIQANANYNSSMKTLTEFIEKNNLTTKEAITLWQQLVDIRKEALRVTEELTLAEKRHQEVGGIFRGGDGEIRYGSQLDPQGGNFGYESLEEARQNKIVVESSTQ